MKIQASLTATAINLKRLTAVLLALFLRRIGFWRPFKVPRSRQSADFDV